MSTVPTSDLVSTVPTSDLVSTVSAVPTSNLVSAAPTSDLVLTVPTSDLVSAAPTSDLVSAVPTSGLVSTVPTTFPRKVSYCDLPYQGGRGERSGAKGEEEEWRSREWMVNNMNIIWQKLSKPSHSNICPMCE